jgi:hypothetical protein
MAGDPVLQRLPFRKKAWIFTSRTPEARSFEVNLTVEIKRTRDRRSHFRDNHLELDVFAPREHPKPGVPK